MAYGFVDFSMFSSGSLPRGGRAGQPVIGLSANVDGETSRLHNAYVQAVLDAGGVPLVIPATDDADALREIVERIDGLVMTGGSDVDGCYFGEATLEGLTEVDPFRDTYDFMLLRLAADRQLPVFGICRGMQVINVAFGGTLWQDLPSQFPGRTLAHSVSSVRKEEVAHKVAVMEGTRLASVTGGGETGVNSRHHQAVKDIAPGFRVTAAAPDGVVEGIEGFPARRIFGVQWHPENMAADGGDPAMKAVFRFMVEEAALFRQAKKIHRANLIVDSHCDTPMLFAGHDIDFGRRDPAAKLDLAKMAEGRLDTAIVAAYIPQGPLDDTSRRDAWEKTLNILDDMSGRVAALKEYAGLARTFGQAGRLKRTGRKAIMLGVENGYAIGCDTGKLERLRDMGVVYMTLCHNGANDLCDSAKGEAVHGGLSPLGREAVREMNRLGIAVDVSHAAESTFRDVLEISTQPVIASHSSARALCDHPRNLTDDQLRAIAAAGGVVQVCLYGPFLVKGRAATVEDAVDHIDHIVRVAGEDHAGIGSDFDGDGGIEGCLAANEFINLTVEMIRRGYSPSRIGKILGGNLRRAVDAVQSVEGFK